MNFQSNPLPSSSKEIEWYWGQCVHENIDLSDIVINEKNFDFSKPVDYFDITDEQADKLYLIGERLEFLSQEVALNNFELQIFGNINISTKIGELLDCVNKNRPESIAYCLNATFKYMKNTLYCAFTVGFVHNDFGMELEIAVVEISQDEGSYILPIYINEEALYYFKYDDIAQIAYWLGNFWVGTQYEMINQPEEIRIIKQHNLEKNEGKNGNGKKSFVLVKRINYIDENRCAIKHNCKKTGRHYTISSWNVRGHYRTLQDGREIYVRPYSKGTERKNENALVKKEYRFVDEKINSDANES
ncbi:MAG: hypothetical protein IKV25_07050 [Clostridia bacterium]|nr:hypothetical protein [Clostridia bacterium]